MSWPARRTEEQQRADRLKAAIDQLGALVRGCSEIDLGTTPATIGLVVRHRGHEMRLTPIGELWVADAEIETPNGDHPYVTLDATGKTHMEALDILAAAMDRARETGEPEEDAAEITRAYGASPTALDELHAGNDGWFGLKEHLSAGEIVEAVCRVVVDGPHGPPGDEACMYLEIVIIDGKPAIEVYE